MIGVAQALKTGPTYLITFSLPFSVTQSLGGLTGSALLNTYQLYREHEFSSSLVTTMSRTDPQASQRLSQQSAALGAVIADPVLRSAQGAAQPAQVARRESNVRAYNDVFMFSAMTAVAFLLWVLSLLGRNAWRRRRKAGRAAVATPANPTPARP